MNKIAEKLVKIMAECAYIQKLGTNDFHRYRYATAADVMEKVNAALVKYGVAAIATPELYDFRDVTNSKGTVEHLATVRTTLTLIDAESGESVSVVGLGSGQDVGDKAIMKAQTAALKYAYMLSLAISTGDDPEADSEVDVRNTLPTVRTDAIVKNSEDKLACSACNVLITPGIARVSNAKFRKPLCMSCQKKEYQSA